ncbi:MAG: protoporphyrinogen oxidase [Planctomycetaceae bacterium]
MPPTPTRIAIIGGGISGLSAALRVHELAVEQHRDVRITLIEAADRLGGVLRTEHIGDYLVEHAADMWITNKPEGVRLCEKLGLVERLIPTNAEFRKSLVLRDGRPHPVPEGFQLMVPEQAWPMLRSPLLSWHGKLRLMAECLVPARRDGADESLADFVRRRCGREAFERLVQPLVGGIYTADPEKLSLLATLPRFIEMEQQHGSLIRGAMRQSREKSSGTSGARYGLFVSLPDGIGELVSALIRRVTEIAEIRCGVKVRAVRAKLTRSVSEGGATSDSASPLGLAGASGWCVESHSAEHFDAIILAVPSYVSASLLNENCPALATELNRIEYASTVVVASGHKLADIAHPLDAFGLVVPHIERRQVLAVSFTSRKFPGRAPDGHILLRTFVGGALQPEFCQLDDTSIVELVRRELRDLLGVNGEPDFAVPMRHTRAMPQYHVGHLELVARIRAAASQCPGLALAGNYLTGVGIPDSIASGEAAAERVMR